MASTVDFPEIFLQLHTDRANYSGSTRDFQDI